MWARRLLHRVHTTLCRPYSSAPTSWMGCAQNPTDSARRHHDSYPIEAARRTICSTTFAVSIVSGTPGRVSCAGGVELFTGALA
jgi:hypothetical protein